MKTNDEVYVTEFKRFCEILRQSLDSGFTNPDLEITYINGIADGLYFKSPITEISIIRVNSNQNNEHYRVMNVETSDDAIHLTCLIERYMYSEHAIRNELSFCFYNLTPTKTYDDLATLKNSLSETLTNIRSTIHLNGETKEKSMLMLISLKELGSMSPDRFTYRLVVSCDPDRPILKYTIMFNFEKNKKSIEILENGRTEYYIRHRLILDELKSNESELVKFINDIKLISLYEITFTHNTDMPFHLNYQLLEAIGDDFEIVITYLKKMMNIFWRKENKGVINRVIKLSKDEQDLLFLEHEVIYPNCLNAYTSKQ